MRRVHVTEDLSEAYMVRNLLCEHGIRAEVARVVRTPDGRLASELAMLPTVWIADESRAAEAEELVAAILERRGAEDWACAGCGASNEGVFTACPTCGRER